MPKKLIQPFLLRRTKTQVLEELPSRTEIVLHVDLSTEEMALYETLRLSAIAQMTALNLPGCGWIAQAALKVSADRILTLNPGHFTRLDPAIAQIVQVPS